LTGCSLATLGSASLRRRPLNTITSGQIHCQLIPKRAVPLDSHLVLSLLIFFLLQDYPFMRHLMNSTSAGVVSSHCNPQSPLHIQQNHHQRSATFHSISTVAILRGIIFVPRQLLFLLDPAFHCPEAINTHILNPNIEAVCQCISPLSTTLHKALLQPRINL
jgi:hypothetical protein